MDTIRKTTSSGSSGRAKGSGSGSGDDDDDEDELFEILNERPWRASKVRNLKYHYRPCKDSWKERLLGTAAADANANANANAAADDDDDDVIYLYATPDTRFGYDSARPDDLWNFPWLWSKAKTERMAWIQKTFNSDVDALSVQEHMELDALYSEFDMPVRWGLLRVKELDVLNVIALNIVFWTDFNGIKPTDLGLRPDGTVRSCPVQFHNCISSSNDPSDLDHYVKPLKWSRAKSPDQAYDEIKSIYFNYPKRGLRWTYGWIDRGGWKPQQFSGNYFYAQANSLSWQFTDDIEFVLDIDKREVQYRSSTRLGQIDWDVERLRYNQFVRMLEKKGGWEVEPVERLRWLTTTPYRWTQIAVDKALVASEDVGNAIIGTVSKDDDLDSIRSKVLSKYEEVVVYITPYVQPVYDQLSDQVTTSYKSFILDPRVAAALQTLQDLELQIEQTILSTSATTSATVERPVDGDADLLGVVEAYFKKIVDILPDLPSTTSPLRVPVPDFTSPPVEGTTTTDPVDPVDPATPATPVTPTTTMTPSEPAKPQSLNRMTDRLGEDARKVMKRVKLSRVTDDVGVNDIEYVLDST